MPERLCNLSEYSTIYTLFFQFSTSNSTYGSMMSTPSGEISQSKLICSNHYKFCWKYDDKRRHFWIFFSNQAFILRMTWSRSFSVALLGDLFKQLLRATQKGIFVTLWHCFGSSFFFKILVAWLINIFSIYGESFEWLI